ncbi:tRNA (guanine(37)-N(1))-methyltransferase isoform X1 [Parasteatoda tepidariorum]|uniref:tRNA (guanine(37)-N(1))-methyltransferase isoform X1 n=2 Tax=Parasteatoda tepidariorum TaxID=114398 RepID=UPI001C71E0D9|nr:tRNA (guanine(37)-N1)-methyltransferase isoform X1 [Parasteatoda tepidariorum]
MNVSVSITIRIFLLVIYSIFIQKKFHSCLTVIRFFTNMIKNSLPKPPAEVRGMTTLDRDKFQTVAQIPCFLISVDKISDVLKILKPCLLKMPKLKPVCNEEFNKRKILLHPEKYEATLCNKVDVGLTTDDIEWTDVQLKYENWTSDDIFRAVLPEDSVGNISSFSIVGHIIHLNLKVELLNYKFLIGQVLLDKYQPNIKTVVNKSDVIENTFRNFKMEHLAGEHNYQVMVKENNCKYAFDYEKVFWNPRLSSEHDRVANSIDSKDTVCDVFAGVGPFAIPLAKKGCKVCANDLNPDSYYWLCHNAKLNKVDKRIQTYNMDGKDFIKTIVRDSIINYFNSEEENVGKFHILMNLPAIALTFLPFFDNLLARESVKFSKRRTIVHCYYFRKKDENDLNVLEEYLKGDVVEKSEISVVRVVAPNKYMMRVTYELPEGVLFFNSNSSCEPAVKRIKLLSE